MIYHPAASAELAEAAVFYERARGSLGERFLAAVALAESHIEAFPEAGPCDASGLRSLAVRGFPYRVLFARAGLDVFVVAVAHTSRRPGYWDGRR